jgi:hypothetical protein
MARKNVKEIVQPERSAGSVVQAPVGALEDHLLELVAEGKLAEAAGGAIRAQKERGLPVTFKRGDQVIKAFPDGREEVLTTLARPIYTIPSGVRVIRGK